MGHSWNYSREAPEDTGESTCRQPQHHALLCSSSPRCACLVVPLSRPTSQRLDIPGQGNRLCLRRVVQGCPDYVPSLVQPESWACDLSQNNPCTGVIPMVNWWGGAELDSALLQPLSREGQEGAKVASSWLRGAAVVCLLWFTPIYTQ